MCSAFKFSKCTARGRHRRYDYDTGSLANALTASGHGCLLAGQGVARVL